jgi:hypothetical protein
VFDFVLFCFVVFSCISFYPALITSRWHDHFHSDTWTKHSSQTTTHSFEIVLFIYLFYLVASSCVSFHLALPRHFHKTFLSDDHKLFFILINAFCSCFCFVKYLCISVHLLHGNNYPDSSTKQSSHTTNYEFCHFCFVIFYSRFHPESFTVIHSSQTIINYFLNFN